MKKALYLLAIFGGIAFMSDTALALRLTTPYDAQILKVQNEYKMKKNSLEANFDRDEQMLEAKKEELKLSIRTNSRGASKNPAVVQKDLAAYHKAKQDMLTLEAKYDANELALKKDRNAKIAMIERQWAKSLM